MTRKLEESFNLPHVDDISDDAFSETALTNNDPTDIQTLEDALSISEKINSALAEVRGMEAHDSEMDEIAVQAVDSYQQLMSLGMNMTDMAAGPVFSNAAAMLKIALEAKDSKVNRKLKQIDLMLKKANFDEKVKKANADPEAAATTATILDRNELLKMIKGE